MVIRPGKFADAEDVPDINVSYSAEQDKADDDEGQEGQDEESEHLLFANNEIHVVRPFLAGAFCASCAKLMN
jgi:hypothetical protein